MRGTTEYDRGVYPFNVDNSGGIAYYVTDVRTQLKVFDAGAGQPAKAATDYAAKHNAEFWAKVDAGKLATT